MKYTDRWGTYDDEDHEFSECAEEAIRFRWPDGLGVDHPLFQRFMLELQLDLIECKLPIMMPSDKRRALETVKWIKQEMKRV
jgi:hypothetical protein